MQWWRTAGLVLAAEALVIAAGGALALLAGDLRWLTLPAMATPPLATVAALLWPWR